jgi:hypothetical protein
MVTAEPTSATSQWVAYRRHGYFFRAAAMLTIAMGFFKHLCRVFFGDQETVRHVMTPSFDRVLLAPMTYAAISGVVLWRRVEFRRTPMKVFFAWSLVYIAGSVPLHVYFGVIRGNVEFYFDFFPRWFSYILFPFYAALLIMFARLRYRP